jgi:Tfp pilus assembly protein PilO
MVKFFNLSKSSRRERILFVGAASVVALVILDRVVLNSWRKNIQSTRQEIKMLAQMVASNRKLLSRKKFILSELQSYSTYLRPGRSEEIEMAELLKEIEELAHESQVSLENIKRVSPVVGKFYQEYGVEVQCQSTLKQWVEFVHLIESSPSLIKIKRASLTVKGKDTNTLRGFLVVSKVVINAETSDS